MQREDCVKLLRLELKYHQGSHILLLALLLLIIPFIAGLSNLQIDECASVIEHLAVWSGVILLVPVFWPEREEELRNLVRSKYVHCWNIYLLRVLVSVTTVLIWMSILILILYTGNSQFPVLPFYLGGVAGSLFLGGMGMLVYSLSSQIAMGYMAPILYFMGCLGSKKYFGNLYLFTMAQGIYEEKYWLGIVAMLMITFAILWQKQRS